jgi:signal transduction histidine kinase
VPTARIAIVGSGKGGKALLKDLVKIPDITIEYVCDINPDAEGMVFARENGIKTCLWSEISSVLKDPNVDLILEVTGRPNVLSYLSRNKPPSANIISSAASKIIFHFIDTQQRVTNELEEYKRGLETKIRERTEEIAWANEELRRRIGEIEKLNAKLQQINAAKTKYLLQATHQLKAPFAAIQSYVDVLLQGFAGRIPGPASEIIVKIKTRCQMLSQTIKDMLELANLNSCVEDNVKMEMVSLGKIAQAVIAFFISVAEKNHIVLEYSHSATSDTIWCNPEQMMIMISNILDNAINYSPENSRVDIVVAGKEQGPVSLSITDRGIGIPKENIPKIFQEYFRSNNAVKKHENGSGLGLSISRRIADIHKADIDVKSALGKGTTISVTFRNPQRPE